MRIATIELTTVSVPYTHRENSSRVNRDGVTDVIVKIVMDNGLVGWGESCSGANVESVYKALQAFEPILLGRNPWNREALWHDAFRRGIWHHREPTFNFAWAGIDMALWDLCGKAVGQPVYNLLGGLQRTRVSYFWYLPTGDLSLLAEECRRGVEAGFGVFYVKTGIDIEREITALRLIREAIGPERKLRIDSNEAWSVSEAARNLRRLDQFHLDFAEQPVPADPVENMVELKRKTEVPLAANEGLWRVADVWEVIMRRACDVLCFSPYWVGSIGQFYRLSCAAALQGMSVCKHTHGELGIAAAACQQVLLALPRVVEGHQQTATMMTDDVLTEPLPIAREPHWGVSSAPGLGVEVDPDKLARYHENYRRVGQYLPYQPENLAAEDPEWRSRRQTK
jgi:L-alanine-DL-glutamate epimerase-like enolase superfamily enzyme